jgi:hypothetical protein
MFPAYVDPIAPGLGFAWAGALHAELLWLAGTASAGVAAVAVLVWVEAKKREVPMRYMLLLYTNPADWQASGQPEATVLEAHAAVTADLRRTGKFGTCDALEPTTAATTVRVRAGRTLVTDGPFAETREQLLGFYMVAARDLDDAIAIAARIPDAGIGSVEIRPIREFAEAS